MKIEILVISVLLGLALIPATLAQGTDVSTPTDIEANLTSLEATTPVSAAALPQVGAFYSAKHPLQPPLPANVFNISGWSIDTNIVLLDDLNVSRVRTIRTGGGVMADDDSGPSGPPGDGGSGSGTNDWGPPVTYTPWPGAPYLTNWVAVLTNDSTTMTFSIASGTNGFAYDIYMTTNVTNTPVYSTWTWLGQGYTGDTYTFTNQPLSNAFYVLAAPQQTMVVAWGDDEDGQCDVPLGLTNAISVAGGFNFSLALLSNGTVVGWGDDSSNETTIPIGLTNVTAIAAGGDFALALLQNGTVRAWGGNGAGQTNVPAGLTNVTAIAAGDACSFALQGNGTVVAWGYNAYGQTNVPAFGPARQVAGGVVQGVALLTNSTVTVWARTNFSGTPYFWNITNGPAGLSNVVAIAAGAYHTLALQSDGMVTAWGAGGTNSGVSDDGQSLVPAGLSNVVEVAGGYLHSLALQADGTVVAWGEDSDGQTELPVNLTGVKAISAGGFHGLAVRSGILTPVILTGPDDQYAVTGGTVTFSSAAEGVAGVAYQWQFNGVNLTGATNASLTLTNVQATNDGSYQVLMSDRAGSVTSAPAVFGLVLPPQIISTFPFGPGINWITTNTILSVTATNTDPIGFPLSYQWQSNGMNLTAQTASSYLVNLYNNASNALSYNFGQEGSYTVVITNAAGSTNLTWNLRLALPGMTAAWGDTNYGECDRPVTLTNVMALSGGYLFSMALKDDGTVVAWGDNTYGQTNVPAGLTNITAIAAGGTFGMALRQNGTVAAWGGNAHGQTNVPAGLTNVTAIAAGYEFCLALRNDGTVVAWGDNTYGQTNLPTLGPVATIAAGWYHGVALLTNSTVASWGIEVSGIGITNVPAGLSNVVSIAAGGYHTLALQANGRVTAWGAGETNTGFEAYGQAMVPTGLSNVMAVAAGGYFSLALLNNGTVVPWGDDGYGQTNVPVELANVKLLAAGGYHALAAVFSPTVSYPISVPQDLLLIYNTNSVDSSNVCAYYLAHRPMVGNANVLGIGCDTSEITSSINFSNEILAPYLNWLTNNPTKHPQYLVLFYGVPSRVDDTAEYPSVQYQLHTETPGVPPFISSINMNGTNDCIAYINKLAFFGTNYSPGKLIISASAGNYGNTNWYFDGAGYPMNGQLSGPIGTEAEAGVTNVQPTASVFGSVNTLYPNYIANATNVAGYWTEGFDGGLGDANMFEDGTVEFSGNSGWYLMATVDSFNGQRVTYQASYLTWFSITALGGTNYSNTPVGAITHVEEPDSTADNVYNYFGMWASGKSFAICAWAGQIGTYGGGFTDPYFQGVGDPFVKR